MVNGKDNRRWVYRTFSSTQISRKHRKSKLIMEKISSLLAAALNKYLSKNEYWYEVLRYTIQVLMEKWICIMVLCVLAGINGYGKEYIFFTVIFMLLRSCCGGFHMRTYLGCIICSGIVMAIVVITSTKLSTNIDMVRVIGLMGMFMLIPINQIAPVLHISRPMNQNEIKMCRKKLKIVTVALSGLMIVFSFYNITWMVVMVSEIIWIVLIFMILGKREYNREISRRKAEI